MYRDVKTGTRHFIQVMVGPGHGSKLAVDVVDRATVPIHPLAGVWEVRVRHTWHNQDHVIG